MNWIRRSLPPAVLLLATAVRAAAQLVAYDGFEQYGPGAQLESGVNGSAGTGLNGGAGWGGAYEVIDAYKSKVRAENRTSSPVTYDNGEIHLAGGVRALRVYDAANGSGLVGRALGTVLGVGETVYVSFLFRTGSASPLADPDFFQWGFDASAASGNPPVSIGANVTAPTPPSQPFCFFARSTTTVANSSFDHTTEIAAATTYFLVGKITGGPGNFNRVDLYVNPATLAEPPTASASIEQDSGVAALSHLLLRTAFLEVGDAYVFDELRVGRSFTSVVSGDGDADGLPDAWELAQAFDPLNAADAALDADGDGQSNLTEYRAGTDPHDGAASFGITALTGDAGGVTLTWRSAPGRRYHLGWSANLAAWNVLSQDAVPVVIDASAGSETTFSLTPAAPDRQFYRIELLP